MVYPRWVVWPRVECGYLVDPKRSLVALAGPVGAR